jgi:Domain of unknown function (DUF4405)
MNGLIGRYSTAATAALFLVVAGSGVAMFFDVGEDVLKDMHKWLAIGLVTAAALHIFRNRAGLMSYFRRRTILAPLALSLVAAAAFVVPASLSQRENPVRGLVHAMQNAKLADVGRILEVSPEALQSALEARGFTVQSAEQRLSDIARAADRPPMAALMTAADAARK